ncbi:hypothetical protein PENTCL1PPCAC_9647, partial [Pristionchus entomophagus]
RTAVFDRNHFECDMNWAWEDVIDGDKGLIKDDKVTVEIHFSITSMKGVRLSPRIDFTDPTYPRHDATLIIDGEKFHVSKTRLSDYSLLLLVVLRRFRGLEQEGIRAEGGRSKGVPPAPAIHASFQQDDLG